jgi:hypothetical protein
MAERPVLALELLGALAVGGDDDDRAGALDPSRPASLGFSAAVAFA